MDEKVKEAFRAAVREVEGINLDRVTQAHDLIMECVVYFQRNPPQDLPTMQLQTRLRQWLVDVADDEVTRKQAANGETR